MVTGFNHSGFVVKDLETMVGFYRDTLGLEAVREIDSVAPPTGDHTGNTGRAQKACVRGQARGRARPRAGPLH